MSFIADLFGGGDTPQMQMPEPTPPPATIDEAARARADQDVRSKRRGRAATILTGETGAGAANTATKTLLGG